MPSCSGNYLIHFFPLGLNINNNLTERDESVERWTNTLLVLIISWFIDNRNTSFIHLSAVRNFTQFLSFLNRFSYLTTNMSAICHSKQVSSHLVGREKHHTGSACLNRPITAVSVTICVRVCDQVIAGLPSPGNYTVMIKEAEGTSLSPVTQQKTHLTSCCQYFWSVNISQTLCYRQFWSETCVTLDLIVSLLKLSVGLIGEFCVVGSSLFSRPVLRGLFFVVNPYIIPKVLRGMIFVVLLTWLSLLKYLIWYLCLPFPYFSIPTRF